MHTQKPSQTHFGTLSSSSAFLNAFRLESDRRSDMVWRWRGGTMLPHFGVNPAVVEEVNTAAIYYATILYTKASKYRDGHGHGYAPNVHQASMEGQAATLERGGQGPADSAFGEKPPDERCSTSRQDNCGQIPSILRRRWRAGSGQQLRKLRAVRLP